MAGKTGRNPDGMRWFDSGWIPRSDWTNVHLGNGAAKNVDSLMVHGLNLPMAYLHVRVLVDADGTDGAANEMLAGSRDQAVASDESIGLRASQNGPDAVELQTGVQGMFRLDSAGLVSLMDTEDWFYRVIITELIRPEAI